MIAKYIVLSNIISIVSDKILHMCKRTPPDIKKKLWFFLMLYQHITTYSSAIKFAPLIRGNVCVKAEGMLKPMKTLVVIQHHVERVV